VSLEDDRTGAVSASAAARETTPQPRRAAEPRDTVAEHVAMPHEDLGPPAVAEEIHMPASSIIPLINAAALSLAIVSITLSWWLVGFAVIVFLWTTIQWIIDTRREIASYPLDHSHH
jgi:hypothetical protein